MNGEVEVVAPRPRPLSGGLWTLFSWLRREERASSSDSLSSVGSDRTAASFAFLAPAHYNINNPPVFLPPPSPPTDSYKKRVKERNVRRQHERDLTLHRKYGLYRSEGIGGYDAFSLPPTRRLEGDLSSKWERDRRATSECSQRRALHVPGKRRAPLPPIRASLESPVTHFRGHRKRRAPQPPLKVNKENEVGTSEPDNIQTPMTSQIIRDDISMQNCKTTAPNTNEKCSKKEAGSKEAKTRSEKGFLKQIFENRKRNSAIDTSAVKILPSISELDKQAASIIENGKLRASKQNESDTQHLQKLLENSSNKNKADSWFCIKCLRKYDSSVSECPYCIFEKNKMSLELLKGINSKDIKTNASNIQTQTECRAVSQVLSSNRSEEKQKLKEMLKEMKDSLPKRSKHEHKDLVTIQKNIPSDSIYSPKDSASETPTLRIGAAVNKGDNTFSLSKPSTSGLNKDSKILSPLESFQNDVTTKPEVIYHDQKMNCAGMPNGQNFTTKPNNYINSVASNVIKSISPTINVPKIENKLISAPNENKSLQTPLRISSLLNPVYVPKNGESKIVGTPNMLNSELKNPKSNVQNMKTDNIMITKAETIANDKSITSTSAKTLKSDIKSLDPITINDKKRVICKNINKKENSSQALNINETKNKMDTASVMNNTNDPSTSTHGVAHGQKIIQLNADGFNQHIKRRELINQLEKSIANGDEHAAAEAAIKLAQLRLSCSVLSFSSQIMSEPSQSTSVKAPILSPNELSKHASRKEIQNKCESGNATLNNPGLVPKTNSKFNPIASSSKENVIATNLVKMNHPVEYNESGHSINNNNSEKIIKPPEIIAHKGTENYSSTEVLTALEKENVDVLISVWVEDKEATRGPIKLKTQRNATVGDLRRQAQTALGLPSHLQRWIVGRTLCIDDKTALVTLAGPQFNAPFYLCLVEQEQQTAASSSKTKEEVNLNNNDKNNVYKELVELEQQALVPNAEVFECGVCIEECKPGDGIILRECVHMFCKDCLADVVRHSGEPDISCPAMGCRGLLQEREIRGLVSPDDYERWLARGLAAAESGTRNAFHCRTKDCTGWALCDPGVRRFLCPVCKHNNCVPCQAIHEGETCEKYRERNQAVSDKKSNQSDDSTRALLNNLINKGEALECPECKTIITKMWGCDWVKCSACKTEICWVTRGRRWGPGGRGDTSAGCRCGVDGKRCHPSCGYCH